MKAIFLLQFTLISFVTLGQKTLLVDNKSFLNGQVDSIKVSYGKFTKVFKLNNSAKSILIPVFDTLTIYPSDYVPLEISGLKSIKSDTIAIVDYLLYKYCANDTITNSHEKRKIFSSKYKETTKTKIIYCDKSTQVIPDKSSVKINGLTYTTSFIIRTSYEWQIACDKRNSYTVRRTHSDAYYKTALK